MRRSKAPSLQNQMKRPKIESSSLSKTILTNNLADRLISTSKPTTTQIGMQQVPVTDENTKYFSVVFGKMSKKKHKTWDGDGVLTVLGRRVTLMDIDGKIVARGRSYKLVDLASLEEGNTLPVGGKEIEIMGSISGETFLTGRCFRIAGAPVLPDENTVPSRAQVLAPTCVRKCFRPVGRSSNSTKPHKTLAAKFDPSAADALVMPRPSSKHIYEQNREGLPVTDVVVDPHISIHLRPHQREGVTFMYRCVLGMMPHSGCGVILADEMGLGKTVQCISLVHTLLTQGPYGGKSIVKRCLIVTPGSLVKNWSKEFQKWLGSERLKVYYVSGDKKIEEYIKFPSQPVLVISYEMFLRKVDSLAALLFDLVVCDEGHRLKNANIKISSALSSLPTPRRVLLTGTPIQNDLEELLALAEFCNPGLLGGPKSSAFRRDFSDVINAALQPAATTDERLFGEKRTAELARLTGMFVLRRTSIVNTNYLPPKEETVVFCRPSQLQLFAYKSLLESSTMRQCLTSRGLTFSDALSFIMALKKLCNDPSLIFTEADKSEKTSSDMYHIAKDCFPIGYSPHDVTQLHSGKLWVTGQMLVTLADTRPMEKLVLVSNYTQTLDVLESLCRHLDFAILRIDGKTPTNKRLVIVDRFNDKQNQEKVLLLSSKAGGVGLNLIGASHLILYDIDWNPANDVQAMARVWRDGQKGRVQIYRLLTTGTIEEKIFQRQIVKQGLSGHIVDCKDFAASGVTFSPEELKDLFCLDIGTPSSTHDLLNCTSCASLDPSVEKVDHEDLVQEGSVRVCQLGQKEQSNLIGGTSRVSMAELMSWQHVIDPQALSLVDDPLLAAAAENITCLFTHVVNADNVL